MRFRGSYERYRWFFLLQYIRRHKLSKSEKWKPGRDTTYTSRSAATKWLREPYTCLDSPQQEEISASSATEIKVPSANNSDISKVLSFKLQKVRAYKYVLRLCWQKIRSSIFFACTNNTLTALLAPLFFSSTAPSLPSPSIFKHIVTSLMSSESDFTNEFCFTLTWPSSGHCLSRIRWPSRLFCSIEFRPLRPSE